MLKPSDFFQTGCFKFADFLAGLGKKYEASAGEIAIAWTLVHNAVTGAIVGLRHESQVDEVLKAGLIELSEEDIQEIETTYTFRSRSSGLSAI